MSQKYSPPVEKILTLGYPRDPSWSNSLPAEVTSEHTDELLRLATDFELFDMPEEDPSGWAPIHARRALGLLGAEAAIAPLLAILSRVDDVGDDWVGEEVPEVLARIGPTAIEPLSGYMHDSMNKEWARVAAVRALELIAKQHRDCQAVVIQMMADALKSFRSNPLEVNTFLVDTLAEFGAREHAMLADQVLRSGRIEWVGFDWDVARVKLGLRQTVGEAHQKEIALLKLSDAVESVLHPEDSPDPFEE